MIVIEKLGLGHTLLVHCYNLVALCAQAALEAFIGSGKLAVEACHGWGRRARWIEEGLKEWILAAPVYPGTLPSQATSFLFSP